MEVLLCDSFHGAAFFRGAPQFINRIFYSMIKEKDQMARSHVRFFYTQGVIIVKISNSTSFDFKGFLK